MTNSSLNQHRTLLSGPRSPAGLERQVVSQSEVASSNSPEKQRKPKISHFRRNKKDTHLLNLFWFCHISISEVHIFYTHSVNKISPDASGRAVMKTLHHDNGTQCFIVSCCGFKPGEALSPVLEDTLLMAVLLMHHPPYLFSPTLLDVVLVRIADGSRQKTPS